MSASKENSLIIAMLIALLMVGTLSVYSISELNQTMDPHESEHFYIVSATMDGHEYTGEGTATYTPENTNYHVYSYNLDIGSAGKHSFGMIFLQDDTPDPTIYTYIGPSMIDGHEISIWEQINEETEYRFYVSKYCTVERAEIITDSMKIVMALSS